MGCRTGCFRSSGQDQTIVFLSTDALFPCRSVPSVDIEFLCREPTDRLSVVVKHQRIVATRLKVVVHRPLAGSIV